MPDNTWNFNVSVVTHELRRETGQTGAIQDHITASTPGWNSRNATSATQPIQTLLKSIAHKPLTFTYQVALRALSLVGPDTFVTQRLLSPRDGAYKTLPPATIRFLNAWLRGAVPLIISCAFTATILLGLPPPPFMLLAGFLFMAFTAAHSRTRFRVALFPY